MIIFISIFNIFFFTCCDRTIRVKLVVMLYFVSINYKKILKELCILVSIMGKRTDVSYPFQLFIYEFQSFIHTFILP